MKRKISITIIIEREKVGKRDIFIASSPDINVFAEGKTIEEAKEKFLRGLAFHLKNCPEDKKLLIKEEEDQEMPLLTKVYL